MQSNTFLLTLLIGASFVAGCSNSSKLDHLDQARKSITEARQVLTAYEKSIQLRQNESAKKHKDYARTLLDEGIRHYDLMGARKSKDVELLQEFSEALLLAEHYDWAGQTYERAAILSKTNASLWLKAGDAFSFSGISFRQRAVDAIQQCLAVVGENADEISQANAVLGRIFWDSGQYALARSHFDFAVEANPKNEWAVAGQSLSKIRNGKLTEGSSSFDALTTLTLLQQQWIFKQWEVVLTPLDQMLSPFEDTAENHLTMARLYVRASRSPDALLALEYSLTLDDTDYQAWNLLGGLSLQQGNTPRAKEAYQKSLSLKADQPRTREMLEKLP
jgi:tetratricopeptide (TPR) repeat protein